MKEVMQVIGVLIFITFIFLIGWSFGQAFYKAAPEYQYINTEPNNRAGLTTYTMIYLHNGEVKYLHFDNPDTEWIFRERTGMNEEIK